MSRPRGIAFLALFALVVSGTCLARAWGVPDTGGRDAGGRAPILVLVSFDGWRFDYIDRGDTPRLRALAARVNQALDWLARPDEARPAFVSLYFEEVDTASHDHGLDSPAFASAIAHLDAALGQLVDGIGRLGLDDRTTIVVVSDHGMAPL